MVLSNTNNIQTDLSRILTGTTTLGQSGLGKNDNEGVLYISQISGSGVSPLDPI